MNKSIGHVYLIGAGPGDIEDLTLRAVKALDKADVVLLDSLVTRDILEFTKAGAQIVDVGKRCGKKSTPQAIICRQMIEFARQGKCVARVKGGDPFVFGRGGEEVAALTDADIAFSVISGITAGIAIPNALGIPLTHRDLSYGITFITGCTKADKGEHNWQAFAQSGTTLVIFMGLTKLALITEKLINSGMSADTPAAAIENGTLANQRHVMVPLSQLAESVRQAALTSPTLIIIGEVIALSQFWTNAARTPCQEQSKISIPDNLTEVRA